MPAAQPRAQDWRFSSRVAAPLAISALTTAVALVGFSFWSATRSDQFSLERQMELASTIIAERRRDVPRDQESVTIRDEAIVRLGSNDRSWIDKNLGSWVSKYFGHDRVYIIDAENRGVYALVDGAAVQPGAVESIRTAVLPLIEDIRARSRAIGGMGLGNAREDRADLDWNIHADDLMTIDGHPAIVSVSPIVSSSTRIRQDPGTEFLHVSVRFLDGTFLRELAEEYQLRGVRFSWTRNPAGDEAAYPLVGNDGRAIGYLLWQPSRPGARLLGETLPVLGAALGIVALVIGVLIGYLRRASTALQSSEAQAQHLAFHDPLTGLPNRALFVDRLDHILARVRRGEETFALLYLDLDRFKHVNDTLGHHAGDELIREVGSRLAAIVRGTDTVARLGGDEFAILQLGSEEAEILCGRVCEAVGRPFDVIGSHVYVGVSIGVARAPTDGADRSELLRKADIALYEAKREGRNCTKVFVPKMDANVQRRQEIESELRKALEAGDQFKTVYQPVYVGDGKTITGVEALIRWEHPRHGMLSPAAFIPVAEECGLIAELGELVLREACIAGSAWPIRTIAVNISPLQLQSPDFADRVLAIVRETGMDPRRLELEITETSFVDYNEQISGTIRRLRAAGIRFALDDFGTGYSSLGSLRAADVDKIKIDRSFVRGLDQSESSQAFVLAILNLSRAIGVTVTAEGVETAEQHRFLEAAGCDQLQGFLFSVPLARDEIDRLLAEGAARKGTRAAA